MNFKILICTLVLALSMPVLAQINLLRNASLEQLTVSPPSPGSLLTSSFPGVIEDWAQTSDVTLISTFSGLFAFDGDLFIEIGSSISQTVNVTPNTTYYVCCRIGSVAATGEVGAIFIDGVEVTRTTGVPAPAWGVMPLGAFTTGATTTSVTYEYRSLINSPRIDLLYLGTDPVCPTSFNDADGDGIDDVLAATCAIDNPGGVTGSCTGQNDLAFSLNLSGNATGTTYTVTGATPAVGTYGTLTMFTIASGADGTDKMITVTDDTDASCTLDITITGATACFSCDSGADGPRFLGLTKSIWMTIGIVTAVGAGAFVLLRKFVF